MRIAAVQHDIVWEDREATFRHLDPLVEQAAGTGASLVVLTEMFATGFSMETHRTAEPEDGPTAAWMQAQAAAHGVVLAGSVALTATGGLATNSMLVVDGDGIRTRYDKLHPFSYAGEHERFRAGDAAVAVELEGLRVGLSVCYDLRFAPLYWSRTPPTDVEVVVANWPEARRHHWRALLDARAIENQTYVVGVNRVGIGGGLPYAGDSRIIDPTGEVLAAAAGQEAVLVADLDAAVVAGVRERFPFRADRRTDVT